MLAGTLLSGCAATPKMSVRKLQVPQPGHLRAHRDDKEKAAQIGQHYQEVADKVAPEVAAPIQKMADIMKQVAATSPGPDPRAAKQLGNR